MLPSIYLSWWTQEFPMELAPLTKPVWLFAIHDKARRILILLQVCIW